MAAKSSILDIDAQIEKLRELRKTLIVKSAERFARAATKAGLAEMEIADEEVDRIFEEIAARFRKAEKKGLVALLLRRVDSQVAGLERRRRFLMTADRKKDAREKFLLGGIVVRAGLSKADRAFLLGGLLELARVVSGSPEYRRLRDVGEEAFKAPVLDGGQAMLEAAE